MKVKFHKNIWSKHFFLGYKVYFQGKINALSELENFLMYEKMDFDSIKKFLRAQKYSFSIVIVADKFVLAAVDRVASYPLFYTESTISDSMDNRLVSCEDQKDLLEYFCGGFVSGNRTLSVKVKRLSAGEYLYFCNNSATGSRGNYFTYVRENDIKDHGEKKYLEELEALTNQAIERTIEIANGRRIFVPLSGGLDSRLILSKLIEKDYDDLYVFTYGVKNSHESIMAKNVCEKLNVKWNFISIENVVVESRSFQKYFNGYLNKCALPSSVPSILETLAFYQITRSDIANDSVIVNGQTGDFTSGGHIRFDLIGTLTKDNLFQYMLKKHYSLWPNILTKLNQEKCFDKLNSELVRFSKITGNSNLIDFYEYWEWKERQSKIVVNGQRLYDSLDCRWSLPLWDPDLLDFWRSCPLQYKLNQSLYVNYLKKYNYKGVFDLLRIPPDPWSARYRIVRYLGFFIKLAFGDEIKNLFYKYMDYYSTYNDQYRIIGRDTFKEHWRDIRNPVSLMVLLSLDRMSIDANKLLCELSECVY